MKLPGHSSANARSAFCGCSIRPKIMRLSSGAAAAFAISCGNRAKLEDGIQIRLPSKIRFTDGYEGDVFFIRKQGRKTTLALTADGPPCYRIGNLARMNFTIVPQTRVHKTLFG